MTVDVAIIGGGPAGSTCGTLLRKYNNRLNVLILEREKFPRDHVGESQLPFIGLILEEMDVWDKVERAGFPIKIGATYRWGQTDDLWDFEFVTGGDFRTAPRPGRFEGQRRQTAFQVDRAVYDDILLQHAKSYGCSVREQTVVREVLREGDRVTGLRVEDADGKSDVIQARHYVDCSGHAGILRRSMGVEVQSPSTLQNIAIWDYWQNAEWAVSIGIGGTRVQVLSLGYGWMWFIPLGPTRTSIGLIVPAEYYKDSKKRPQDLYREAMESDPIIAKLTQNATAEGKPATTKDWSFVADRLAGENWFLAGESAGFADPILAAGMTLAHAGARDVAYTILALDRKDYEREWLISRYDEAHRKKIGQHIRFADFWYTANGCFTDLKEYTSAIAEDAGLHLEPDKAWQWLGTGGFVDDDAGNSHVGGYSVAAAKQIVADFTGGKRRWLLSGTNTYELNLDGAAKSWSAVLEAGRITRYRKYVKDGKALPNYGTFHLIIELLKRTSTLEGFCSLFDEHIRTMGLDDSEATRLWGEVLQNLESMVSDGWVTAGVDTSEPVVPEEEIDFTPWIHRNQDVSRLLERA